MKSETEIPIIGGPLDGDRTIFQGKFFQMNGAIYQAEYVNETPVQYSLYEPKKKKKK